MAIELHASHDCADIDGLVEGWSGAQRAHAVANFADQRLGNALLHQQARSGTAHLSLVEPDSVYQAFHRAVEIGIVEHDERRLAAQLEREPLVTLCSGSA